MATIQNFGAPLGGGQRARMLQPKAKLKFRVRVMGFGPIATPMDMTAQTQSVGRPQNQQEAVTVHSYNSTAYFAGKSQWQPTDWVVRDDITNAASRLIGHQLQKQMNHFQQTSALAGSNYKFDMKIETLDGDDGVIETWNLENCWIESTNYGDFDYTDTGAFLTIQMSIRFDNATQEDGLMPLVPELKSGVFV